MFWDNVSLLYDFVETVYNGKVYQNLGKRIAEEITQDDIVLECACGTGAISKYVAPKCKQFIATDISKGMLKRAAQNCWKFNNLNIRYVDMTRPKEILARQFVSLSLWEQILSGSLI